MFQFSNCNYGRDGALRRPHRQAQRQAMLPKRTTILRQRHDFFRPIRGGDGAAHRPTIEKFPWRVNAESLTCIQLNHEFCYE